MSEFPVILEGVRRSFGAKAVLRGATAKAGRGRVIGLLGRNGEGKTTLFKVLLDLLEADAGRVEVLGLRPDGSGAIRARVGWVPERPEFHPFMTAADALALRARFLPRWSVERAAATARTLGLDVATRLGGASKGTLAKLAWVCAVAHDPELLLLDEPTSGLDALVREELLESLVRELHDSGKTILVANHRMEELAGLLDEVWLLKDGTIVSHEVESLRRARRLRGRLREGGLGEVAVLDESAARAAAGRFEAFEESPLPLDKTLSLLLQGEDAR